MDLPLNFTNSFSKNWGFISRFTQLRLSPLNSQKQAVTTLIEKKDKERRWIKNWRPISLVNVDVKIGSKAIAQRIENILPHIIHHYQNAFVKGRTIFDAVRTISDVMEFTNARDYQSIMSAIDFEKAFDSLDWNFILRSLEFFGRFGASFLAWIKTFYKNITSCVANNDFFYSFIQTKTRCSSGRSIIMHLHSLS